MKHNGSRIMYPVRLNSPGPIQTIHRQVAKNLHEEYEFSGLDGVNIEKPTDNSFNTIPINSTWPRYKRGFGLLRLYLSDYDVVHTGASGYKTHPLLLRLGEVRGATHIHTHHSTTTNNYEQQEWLATHAESVTAVSPFVANWAKDEFGLSEVTVIPNGVDCHQFEPVESSDEQMFVFVGRLVERKHPELILRLAKKRPNAKFKIRGSGPLENEIVDTAHSIDNVELVPRLDIEELSDLYANATAVLCPYEREGFGMVVIESMASGTPVIGLNSGNLPALIETGRNGILCESLDPGEWITAMETVQTERERFEPRKSAKSYSWGNIASSYEAVYDEVSSL